MDWQRFLETWRGVRAENRFHRIATVVLAGAVAVLGYGLLARQPVVVLVPPALKERVWVAERSAQEGYYKAWALHLAMLLGNVTPGNLPLIEEAIGPLLAPAIYEDVMRALHGQADEIRRNRITLRFEPRRVLAERSTGKVFVEGFAYSQAPGAPERRRLQTYEFVIAIEGYAPMIEHLDTYPGEARTEEVLARLKRLEEAERGREARP